MHAWVWRIGAFSSSTRGRTPGDAPEGASKSNGRVVLDSGASLVEKAEG